MSGFSSNSIKVESDDGRNVRLLEPVTFIRKDGISITIPINATADGASTPRILWRILPPFGNYWMSAVLHDYLYRMSAFDKSFCDETFMEAMLDEPVSRIKANLIYQGVRIFGGPAFKNARYKRTILT